MDSIDIDTIEHSNRDESIRFLLRPVKPLESGEGLPYAPENWPNPGDTWRWKVGPRVNNKGHFRDRYLYPPKNLPLPNLIIQKPLKGNAFRSKPSLEQYIRLAFPKADVRKFFASFSWIIPSTDGIAQKLSPLPVYSSDEDPIHGNKSDIVVCKAGNEKCRSLMYQSETRPFTSMPSEPNFCFNCCCILCCKPISLEHEGYSYIKCEGVVSESHICGHVAHVNCALRAYMAGTIGGKIGLDAEYYCRRCDTKMDLVPHVKRFLEICQTVEHQSDVEKILNLGICILRGSQRYNAKELLNFIESTIIKIKCGTSFEDVGNDDTLTIWSDFSDNGDNDTLHSVQDASQVTPIEPMLFNYQAEIQKLDEGIHSVLHELRKAQESEYQIAERKLHAQKECLDNLYTQLEMEKSELQSRRVSGTDSSSEMTNVLKRLDQISIEVTKLKQMEEVAKGFGRTPRRILEDYFHLKTED